MNYTTPQIASSALITIDTQVDFTDKGAPAEIPGTSDALSNITDMLRWYRHNNLLIIHVVRLYRIDGSNVDLCRRELIESGNHIVAPDTEGAELAHQLKLSNEHRLDSTLLLEGHPQYWSKNEMVLYKPRWGAFYNTPLESILRERKIDTVVFCGCNFPNCPRTSIYEASERDFRIVLVEDAISQLYEKGKAELLSIGVDVVKTRDFLTHANSEPVSGGNG